MLLAFLSRSWASPDVWYHLAWGRDLLTGGAFVPLHRPLLAQPLVANTYWLFQGTLFLLYSLGGVVLCQLAFGSAWLATASLVARRGIGPWAAVLMILVAQTRFEPRPEVLSYLFLVLTMTFASAVGKERPSRYKLLAIFVVQVLWSNVHGFFALGPLIFAARTVSAGRRWRATTAPLLVSVAATFVSPFGWRNWETVVTYARLGGKLGDLVAELTPPSLAAPSPALAAYAVMFVASLALPREKGRDAFAHVLAGAGLVLAALSARNLTLGALLGSLLWSEVREARMPGSADRLAFVANVVTCLAISFAVVHGAWQNAFLEPATFGPKLEPAAYPISATEYLRAMGFHGSLFAGPGDGGYVEWHLPEAKVIGDSYFADAELTREYLGATRDVAAFAKLDEKYHFDAVLIGIENARLYERLREDDAFGLAFVDPHRALFVKGHTSRTSGEFYEGADLRHWANALGPRRWIGIAGDYGDWDLLRYVLRSLGPAARVPASLLGSSVGYAVTAPTCDPLRAARDLRPFAFADRNLDLAALDELFAKSPAGCLN